MITLEPTSAQWASVGLEESAKEMRKKATNVRARGARHIPIKNACRVLADAYERCAIELERTRKQITTGGSQ